MRLDYAMLAAALLIMLSIGYGTARAETTWLVVPSQYWVDEHSQSGHSWQPTQITPFRDFGSLKGENQCAMAARALHIDPLFSPNFSFCTPVRPEIRIWH